jgi:hypothetical protein
VSVTRDLMMAAAADRAERRTLKSKKRVRKVTLLRSRPPYPNEMIRPRLPITLRIALGSPVVL